jgi:hypothetical protein
VQTRGGRVFHQLQVKSYDELVQEERTRQVMGAILVGVAAGANAAAAANAGYGVTPGGRTYYSPTAAAIAQANASYQNEAMIAGAAAQNHQRMAELEGMVIKDHTLIPGEWYGGQLHIERPQATDAPPTYLISVTIGGDVHRFDVSQGPAR